MIFSALVSLGIVGLRVAFDFAFGGPIVFETGLVDGRTVVQQIITKLVDDVDGKEIKQGGETVRFAVDGVSYEIDLNDKNAKKLRQSLAVYVEHGRRVGGRRSGAARAAKAKSNKADLAAMRQWARDNGYTVSDRGRVSREVQDAYSRAR